MKWATIAGGGWSLGRGTLEGRGTPRGGWYQESGSVVKRAWRKEGAQGRADAAKRKNQVSLPLSLPSIPATFPLSKRPRVIVAFTNIVITSPPDTFPRPRWGIGVTRVEAPPLSASSWSHARTRLFITRRRRGPEGVGDATAGSGGWGVVPTAGTSDLLAGGRYRIRPGQRPTQPPRSLETPSALTD